MKWLLIGSGFGLVMTAFVFGVAFGPQLTSGPSQFSPLAFVVTSTPVPSPTILTQPAATAIVAPKPISTSELASAAQRARFLTARYGVPESEVASLTKETYDLAGLLQIAESDRTALHGTVLDFAENGGVGLRPLGIEGDAESIARKLGLGSGRGLIAFTRPELVRIQTNVAIEGIANFILHGNH